jgi:DNA invertase Pin-like site-specific DNA recombinase
MNYGYARVSTDGQSVEAQVRQLAKAGCTKVFREVASGAKTDRAQLRKALDRLEAGDVLMVTRLDRLARSTRDLLNTHELAELLDPEDGLLWIYGTEDRDTLGFTERRVESLKELSLDQKR